MDREYTPTTRRPGPRPHGVDVAGPLQPALPRGYSETPYAYLMTRRIERAKAMLRRGDLSVTDVCFAVGCTSLGSFSARFTELVGETPSTYRARNRDDLRSVPACETMLVTRPAARQPGASRSEQFGEASAAARS